MKIFHEFQEWPIDEEQSRRQYAFIWAELTVVDLFISDYFCIYHPELNRSEIIRDQRESIAFAFLISSAIASFLSITPPLKKVLRVSHLSALKCTEGG